MVFVVTVACAEESLGLRVPQRCVLESISSWFLTMLN